jgi:hypothetical protein
MPPSLQQRLKLARRRRGAMAARARSLCAPVLAMCPSAQAGEPSVLRFQRGGDQRTETQAMTHIYHATPYDISATGFYFTSLEDYQAKAATHRNEYGQPVEEYMIQYIDGDAAPLFNALEVTQATLELWFAQFEELDGEDAVKAIYLADDRGDAMAEIIDRLKRSAFTLRHILRA